jgi:hypothetical protein
VQQTAVAARGRWKLGNQRLGQFKIKIGQLHEKYSQAQCWPV